MHTRKSIVAASLGTIALVATLTLAGGATANAATRVTAPHKVVAAASCWTDITSGQSLCVSRGHDLVDAVEAATGRTIALKAGMRIGGVTVSSARAKASLLRTSAAASQTIVSAVYDDVNYGGGTYLMSADGSGCDWGLPNMGTFGWNDRVSSFKSYNGCTTALFKNINYGSTKIGYSSSKSSLGTMNDQASSWATQ